MPNLNKVMLMGNLTRDVEVRQFPSGGEVGSFGIAVNEKYKDRDGQLQERTTFVDCEIFGNRVGPLAQYASKGSPLFVEGKLQLDQWEDRDGTKRSKMKVVVLNFEFIPTGEKRDGGGGRVMNSSKPSGDSYGFGDGDPPF